jgi:ankyrin repeat protein
LAGKFKYSIEDMKKTILDLTEDDFMEKLKEYNIFEQDKFGNDIIHYFIKNAKVIKMDFNKIMDKLLEMGIDINTKQKTGNFQRTYLQLSVIINNRAIFEYLIKNGADVNCTDRNGNGIASDAMMNYHKDKNNYEYYIKTLLEKGIDINRKNNYGVSTKELAENIGNDYFKNIRTYILNYKIKK